MLAEVRDVNQAQMPCGAHVTLRDYYTHVRVVIMVLKLQNKSLEAGLSR